MRWLTVNNGRGYDTPAEGVLAFKDSYKTADVHGFYHLKFCRGHVFSAGLGATYTVGVNYYYHEVDALIPGGTICFQLPVLNLSSVLHRRFLTAATFYITDCR
jgi:hypothetical protein